MIGYVKYFDDNKVTDKKLLINTTKYGEKLKSY